MIAAGVRWLTRSWETGADCDVVRQLTDTLRGRESRLISRPCLIGFSPQVLHEGIAPGDHALGGFAGGGGGAELAGRGGGGYSLPPPPAAPLRRQGRGQTAAGGIRITDHQPG